MHIRMNYMGYYETPTKGFIMSTKFIDMSENEEVRRIVADIEARTKSERNIKRFKIGISIAAATIVATAIALVTIENHETDTTQDN